MRTVPTWTYPYEHAQALRGGTDAIDTGDELGLLWKGPLQRPELAPPGHGRRAIVVRVIRAGNMAAHIDVALIDDGQDAHAGEEHAEPQEGRTDTALDQQSG